MNENITDEERKIQSLFLDYFSKYQFNGVQVIFNNRSLTFNFTEDNIKYIQSLLASFYDDPSIFIIFRTIEKTVSFTSDSLSYEELFAKVKNKMDEVKFESYKKYSEDFSPELNNIYNLFDKFAGEKIDLTMGIKNKDGDKLYKFVTRNTALIDNCIKSGLTMRDYTAHFRRSNFSDVNEVFKKMTSNPIVYYKDMDSSNMGFLNVFLFVVIDLISIALGFFLLFK